MSLLLCPLCGKCSSVRHFEPEEFDEEIYVENVVGLGRGRGFRVSERGSILHGLEHEEIRGKIADRLIKLLAMLLKNGDISEDEVSDRLGLTDNGVEEISFEEDVDDLVKAAGLLPARFPGLRVQFRSSSCLLSAGIGFVPRGRPWHPVSLPDFRTVEPVCHCEPSSCQQLAFPRIQGGLKTLPASYLAGAVCLKFSYLSP